MRNELRLGLVNEVVPIQADLEFGLHSDELTDGQQNVYAPFSSHKFVIMLIRILV